MPSSRCGKANDGAETLLHPAMRNGRRVPDLPDLPTARRHAAASLARLPQALRRLETGQVPVRISDGVRALADAMDRAGRESAGGEP